MRLIQAGSIQLPQGAEQGVVYLNELVLQMQEALEEISKSFFTISYAAPDKPRESTLRFADGVIWNPGSGRGLYQYTFGVWIPLFTTSVLTETSAIETPSGTINGVNATFTLSATPTCLQLYVNGLLQKAGVDYTLAASTITFSAGSIPATGDSLRACVWTSAVIPYVCTPTGVVDGSNTVFTIPAIPAKSAMYVNGMLLTPTTDYTLSGTVLTLGQAPLLGYTLSAHLWAAGIGSVIIEVPSGAINGVNAVFTLSKTPTTLLLYLNGQAQFVTDDYTIVGGTVTFVAAKIPQTGDILRALLW